MLGHWLYSPHINIFLHWQINELGDLLLLFHHSHTVVHVEALEHHCCCLLLSPLASGKESACLLSPVTRRALQMAVTCVLALRTPPLCFYSLQKWASLLSESVIVWRLLGSATTQG